MKSAACFVGLVLVAFAAVTAADGNPSTWLRDYLEPPSQAKSLSGHYEPLEKKTACFRQVSFCHVKCDGVDKCRLNSFNDYANLACITCPEDLPRERYYSSHHKEADYALMNPTGVAMSKCYMHKVRNEPIPVANSKLGVSLVGTFTGVCRLDSENDKKCDLPEGCDDVEVSITGYVYEIPRAVRVGPAFGGAPGDIPNVCRKDGTGPIREAPETDKPDSPQAQIQRDASSYSDPEPVIAGSVVVYTGPFTVHSHSHPLKYQRGYFQFSVFSGEGPTTDDVEGLPRLGDETYKFEFINERSSHY